MSVLHLLRPGVLWLACIAAALTGCAAPAINSADLARVMPLTVEITASEWDLSPDLSSINTGSAAVPNLGGSIGIAASAGAAAAAGSIAGRARRYADERMAPLKTIIGTSAAQQQVQAAFSRQLASVPAMQGACFEACKSDASGRAIAELKFARRLTVDGGAAVFTAALEIRPKQHGAFPAGALHRSHHVRQVSLVQVAELLKPQTTNFETLPTPDQRFEAWAANDARLFLVAQQEGVKSLVEQMARKLPALPTLGPIQTK